MPDSPVEPLRQRLQSLMGEKLTSDYAELESYRQRHRITLNPDDTVTVEGITAADPISALAAERLQAAPTSALKTPRDPTVPESSHYLHVLKAKLAEERLKAEQAKKDRARRLDAASEAESPFYRELDKRLEKRRRD